MNAVLAAELNERRAGVMFSEDRDDLRLGDARRAQMSILFGLSAGETHDFKWPGLPGQRQNPGYSVRGVSHLHALVIVLRGRFDEAIYD